MNTRRAIGAVMIVAVALFASACSSDSDGGSSSDDPTTTTTTVAELTDEEYAAEVATADSAIAAAGTDLCKLVDATQGLPSTAPANEAQTKQIVELAVTLYTALGTVEGVTPEDAATILGAVQEYAAAAEAAGYTVEFISSEDGQAAITSDAFIAAVTPIQERAQTECMPADSGGTAPGTETTVPAG